MHPANLSASLRQELSLYLYKDVVTSVEFLSEAPVGILVQACMSIEPQYFMQQDTIFRRGDCPEGFYFVEKGRVVLSEEDQLDWEDNSIPGIEITVGGHIGIGTVVAAVQLGG